jgi:hypothetical protein
MLRFDNVAELNREYMRRAPTLYGILAQVNSLIEPFEWDSQSQFLQDQTLEQQEAHFIRYLQHETIADIIRQAIEDFGHFIALMLIIASGQRHVPAIPQPNRQPSRPRRGAAAVPHIVPQHPSPPRRVEPVQQPQVGHLRPGSRPRRGAAVQQVAEPNVAPIRADEMVTRDEYIRRLVALDTMLTAYYDGAPRLPALQDTFLLIANLRDAVRLLYIELQAHPANQMYRQVDVIVKLEEFEQLFNLAQEDQRRTCVNQGIDFGPDAMGGVDYNNMQEVPNNNFIQLTNGTCWQVDSLVGLIKYTNGINSVVRNGARIPSLRNYPTEVIWTDPSDLQRLLAKADRSQDGEVRDLRGFLERLERNRIDSISDATMNMMVKTMHLLSAKGPETTQYFNENTTSEPYLQEIYAGTNGNVEKLLVRTNARFNENDPANIAMFRAARIDVAHVRYIRTEANQPDGKNWYLVMPEEEYRKLPADIQAQGRSFPQETAQICIHLYVTNKSQALTQWEEYFNSLSDEEKSALNTFVPDLQIDLRRCRVANPVTGRQLCAMVTARTIYDSYNSLRQRKGLGRIPRPFTDAELEPPAICADVQAGLGLYEGRAYIANMM